jgi:hypothetical protein
MSAREDARIWRALTGLSQLIDTERGQERIKECERRHMPISVGSKEGGGSRGRRGREIRRGSWESRGGLGCYSSCVEIAGLLALLLFSMSHADFTILKYRL